MFDRFLVVDWSAANAPRTGTDSIWIADTSRAEDLTLHNPRTRSEALRLVEETIIETVEARQRLFVGLDFAFGYPKGSYGLPGEGRWESVWHYLHEAVEDDGDNRSNRFTVAAQMNRAFHGEGPFWGHPHQHRGRYPDLPFTRPDYASLGVREKRYIDAAARAASPVWKMAFTGSVGSQTLTGIAGLETLRRAMAGRVSVWPFETAFADSVDRPVVLAEIYPSLVKADRTFHEVKDACQVATLARGFERRRSNGTFAEMLDGPRCLGAEVRDAALTHEGWMVGFGDEVLPL